MPAYVMAGMAIYGAIKGSSKSKEAKQADAMSANMQRLARNQHTMAEPALRQAMNYYTQLATGSRNQIQNTLAPQISQMNQLYSGAARKIGSGSAGPTRERQLAELDRERAGAVGMLPFMARQNANQQLGQMGQGMFNNALNAGNSSLPFMQFGQQQKDKGEENWSQMGEVLGSIFAPYLMQQGGAGKTASSSMPYGNFFTNGMKGSF